MRNQKGITTSMKKKKNPGELILKGIEMRNQSKNFKHGVKKSKGKRSACLKTTDRIRPQILAETDCIKQLYDEPISPDSTTSKAILPYSISITTLNKLLNPLQGFQPLISDGPPSKQPLQQESEFGQKKDTGIGTDNTVTFQLSPQFITDYQSDPSQDKDRGNSRDITGQRSIPSNTTDNQALNGSEQVNNANTTKLMQTGSLQYPATVTIKDDTSKMQQKQKIHSSSNQFNLIVPDIPVENMNHMLQAPSVAKDYTGTISSINSSSMKNNQDQSFDNSDKLRSTDRSSFSANKVRRSSSDRPSIASETLSESSAKNFISASANDEYSKLTDLIHTDPESPSDELWKEISEGTDDGYIFLPFIEIDVEDNTMKTSYPDNNTPISNGNNAKRIQQMPNTARRIPHDLQEEEDYSSPLIMRHLIKKPDDIYLTNIVKAYQYPKAYHALISYLKMRFNKDQLIEVAKSMAKYRPSFISATKSLYENDLIFTERSFQRTLLEYEHLINMSPSPTIIWRRTGEIVALTNEFATMTGYSKMSLLSKRTFIVELMDDESALRYFKSFSEMAFGDLNATYLTDCNIRKANNDEYLKCSCVWTIKRDVFDIPMLIVGQFLPVLF